MTKLMHLKSLLAITTLALLLSGCSLFQPSTPTPLGDWSFKGKMAVRSVDQASKFNVEWLQHGEHFQIVLSGPLGQGTVSIKGEPGAVTLHQGNKVVKAPNLEGLVYEQTGLDLPLEHLQYWVQALPDPDLAFEQQLNEQGQTTQISQAGWVVLIEDYFQEETDLPRKLSFARTDDSGKLIIQEWTQAPTPN